MKKPKPGDRVAKHNQPYSHGALQAIERDHHYAELVRTANAINTGLGELQRERNKAWLGDMFFFLRKAKRGVSRSR